MRKSSEEAEEPVGERAEEGAEGEEEEVLEHLVEQEVVEPLAVHELHACETPLLAPGTVDVYALSNSESHGFKVFST